MKPIQKIAATVLVVLLVATVYGLVRTAEVPKTPPHAGKDSRSAAEAPLVDQTPLKTAHQLAQLVAIQEEQPLAKEALRLADYEVDLAYDAAMDQVKSHPPPLSAEAKQAKERLEKAQKVLADAEATVARLKDTVAKTKDLEKKDQLEEQLDAAEADRDLAEDEVDDAQEDFRRAGGDAKERIQEAQKEHSAAQHNGAAPPVNSALVPQEPGLIHRYEQWSFLHSKQMRLWRAKQDAENSAAALTVQHNTLEAQLEAEKEKAPALAHHAKKAKQGATAPAAIAQGRQNIEDLAALAEKTWQLASQQEALAIYDRRINVQKQLAGVYGQWIQIAATQQRAIVHRALIGGLIILVIALFGLYFGTLLDRVLSRLNMDRRQAQTLHGVIHVALRVVGVLLVLLVIIGPPGQLGTFLGLAGAGLTVALKDFIVGFIGWFVLMGKNGIRLGDWVEINGVTGEVVEIGPIHTVLLETGNWTDSGHPTGRRVTFTNSFAIEGHYFNFSTSGQWMWDELQLVLPTGHDPYPVIDAIQKKVAEATAESAKQAEQEWRRAARSRDMNTLSAAPAVNVKPIIGGIEIAVRYVTRANERYQMRAKLYQAAVDLLGGRGSALAPAEPSRAAP